ncbi:MAG TPA: serine/threonine-protein kinase [Kofleriaceae bacterium]|nr:serine/threonine-protein kinase [Kofleriaceae bacterium]
MRDSADPVEGSGTDSGTIEESSLPATVVERRSSVSLPDPADLPRASEPMFRRDLDSEPSRRDSIDSHQRKRLWRLTAVIPGLCAIAALSLRVMGGDPTLQRVLIAGLVVASGSALWLGWLARSGRTQLLSSTIAWLLISGGVCCMVLYFGMYSPAMMLPVIALFFVGTRDELPVALAIYLTFAVFHGVLAIVFIGGGLHEPGVFTFVETGREKLLTVEALLQGTLLATLIVSCAIRRSMVRTVRDLEHQARSLGHHELLLEDARRAFEISLRAAGGGRFSHQILGSYRLGRLLGEGAMGEVYEAIDTRSGGAAAVKLLRREVIGDRRVVERFLTEARILSSLSTDHIARVLETADPAIGLPYIAMERLSGRDLRQYLKDHPDGRLPLAEVDELLRQIARGIDAAHRADIVHRDLKPSNVFRDDSGTWKILDFGVSKVGSGEHTTEHALVGTPNFMAPEQMRGGTIDARSDIFALGAIVYRAITGRMAFNGDTLAAIAVEITHHTPPRPTELVPELPASVDEVVMKAIAKEPAQRFHSAIELSEAFTRAIDAAADPAPAP